ncbi:MAG: hypothetical protein JNM99_23535 [Verrucomicrobiaceae bacterium]|nr:hypothetical protein [Verrucomicrobiaceae bacterium]
MLASHSPLEISLFSAVLNKALILLVTYVAGSTVLRVEPRQQRSLADVALILVAGTLTLIGLYSTLMLRRFNVHSLFPLLLIGWSMWQGMEKKPEGETCLTPFTRREGWPLLAVFSLSMVFACYEHGWGMGRGGVVLPWSDLGYFGLLAQELPQAKVASQWAAVFSSFTQEAGAHADAWYHWGPMWLAAFAARFSGASAMNAMIYIVIPMLTFMMSVTFGAIIQRVTQWTNARCLLLGFAALIAVAMPARAMQVPLANWFGIGMGGPHSHLGYGMMFSYMLEGLFVAGAAVAWLNRRTALALVMLFCAGISTPHTVAGMALAAGGWGLVALMRREFGDVGRASAMVATLGSAWLVCHVCFGVSLPKMDDSPMLVTGAAEIGKATTLLLRDWAMGVFLAVVLIPGLWFLVRSDDRQHRALGWMAIGGMMTSYVAYHFLMPTGDRGHFTTYAHLVVGNLAGFVGLCALCAHGTGWLKTISSRLLVMMVLMGIYDSVHDHRAEWKQTKGYTMTDLQKLKDVVQGQPLGYFAVLDRQWWISYNAPLGAVLESPILRLNSVYARDHLHEFASFYGSGAPYVLVPKQAGEEDLQWSLRLARKLGIRYVLETDRDPLPEALRPQVKLVIKAGVLSLFELTPAITK